MQSSFVVHDDNGDTIVRTCEEVVLLLLMFLVYCGLNDVFGLGSQFGMCVCVCVCVCVCGARRTVSNHVNRDFLRARTTVGE